VGRRDEDILITGKPDIEYISPSCLFAVLLRASTYRQVLPLALQLAHDGRSSEHLM
jgi:hypothetical protein